ncbi:MAG: ABC transporter permease, partial [Phototrophicaceae bacterium]
MATAQAKMTTGQVAKLDRQRPKGESLWTDAFKRLLRNRAAVLGGLVILLAIVIAVFAGAIAPRHYAQQILEEKDSAPAWVINLFPTMKPADQRVSLSPPPAWNVLVENGQTVAAGETLAENTRNGTQATALFAGVAYFDGNYVAVTKADIQFYELDDSWEILIPQLEMLRPVDAGTVIARKTDGSEVIQAEFRSQINYTDNLLRVREQDGGFVTINNSYPLGADSLGRDLLSRIIYGARVSLSVAFIGPFVSIVIGLAIGLFAGYVGGRVDNILMRVVDVMYAFPTILLIILLMAFFRTSFADLQPGTFQYQLGLLDNRLGGMLFIFVGIGATA